MSSLTEKNAWLWVVVMDPGKGEQLVGQEDGESRVSFIPAFLGKEEALEGLDHLARDEGHQYEVQAMRSSDLARQAAESGFKIYVLTAPGEILEKIEP